MNNKTKLYNLKFYEENYNIFFKKSTYVNNGTLAILMYCIDVETGCEEPFATLTVNINDSDIFADDYNAFIDTNNLGNKIIQWLEHNKLGKKSPFINGFSGFCQYPLFIFNKDFIDTIDSEE